LLNSQHFDKFATEFIWPVACGGNKTWSKSNLHVITA